MLVNSADDDVGKDFRSVNTASVSKNQGESDTQKDAAKGHRKKVLRIQFKGDFFKTGKAKSIYDKTNKCFSKEIFSEKKDTGKKKGQKNHKHANRQVIAGKLADDHCNSCGPVINGIIGKQDTGHGEAGKKSAQDNGKVGK